MGLFICEKCGVVENTALAPDFWISKKKLCSLCGHGKWHGKFPRIFKLPKGERDLAKIYKKDN